MDSGVTVETQSHIEDPFAEGLIEIDTNRNHNHYYGSKSGRGQNTSNQSHQDQRFLGFFSSPKTKSKKHGKGNIMYIKAILNSKALNSQVLARLRME